MSFRLFYPAMPKTNRYAHYGSPLSKGSCDAQDVLMPAKRQEVASFAGAAAERIRPAS